MTPTPAQQARRRWLVPAVAAAAAAAGALIAPTAVQAADQLDAVIRDPYNSSALARLSEDGRLGVRGETTTQAGLPSNAWSAYAAFTGTREDRLLTSAPPGSGIGISQITAFNRDAHRSAWAANNRPFLTVGWSHPTGSTCPAAPDEADLQYVHHFRLPAPAKDEGGPAQMVFPVPLTVPPSPTGPTCLYAGAATGDQVGLTASGITGRPTRAFAPAKGEPAPQPSDDVTIKPSPDDTSQPQP